jgi:hypothetical protein
VAKRDAKESKPPKPAETPAKKISQIEAMKVEGLWSSPGGATPDAAVYASILREINAKGKDARFRKTERGHFTLASRK